MEMLRSQRAAQGFGTQRGESRQALSFYQQALQFNSTDPMIYQSMAALHEQLGEYEQAVGPAAKEAMRVALSIDPQAKAWVKDWLTRRFNVKFEAK